MRDKGLKARPIHPMKPNLPKLGTLKRCIRP